MRQNTNYCTRGWITEVRTEVKLDLKTCSHVKWSSVRTCFLLCWEWDWKRNILSSSFSFCFQSTGNHEGFAIIGFHRLKLIYWAKGMGSSFRAAWKILILGQKNARWHVPFVNQQTNELLLNVDFLLSLAFTFSQTTFPCLEVHLEVAVDVQYL